MITIRDILKKNKNLSKIGHSLFVVIAKGLTLISPRLNTSFIYKVRFGRRPNLKSPQTLNEKVLWLKLFKYNYDDTVRKCADKYAVREYLKEKGLESILVPLHGVYSNTEEINWAKLPKRFFIKWNFGCGLNIRCEDLSSFDITGAINILNKWENNTDYLITSELQYRCKQKLIIVEENLSPNSTVLPEDYKVYCFNGKPLYVLYCHGRELGHAKFYLFDRDFILCKSYTYDGLMLGQEIEFKKPEQYDKLFEYAENLSKGFDFVRVDFYIINNKIYFGELTFTSSGGRDLDITPEFDKLGGDLINITKNEK